MSSSVDDFVHRVQLALDLAELRLTYLHTIGRVLPGVGYGLYVSTGARPLYAGTMPTGFMRAYEQRGRVDDPVLEVVNATGEVATESDVEHHRWLGSGSRAVLAASGLSHTIKVPLMIEGRPIGTMNVARRDRAPATDVRLARYLGRQLSTAIERCHRFDQAIAHRMTEPPAVIGFTQRERQLAGLIAAGLGNREIAETCQISINTVKEHLKRMYAKLDVHTRAELVQRICSSR